MMLPQVTMPMGSSMGHIRNLYLSDLFLDIYHFYTKPLLSLVLRLLIMMLWLIDLTIEIKRKNMKGLSAFQAYLMLLKKDESIYYCFVSKLCNYQCVQNWLPNWLPIRKLISQVLRT